jgi:hypothetical protein
MNPVPAGVGAPRAAQVNLLPPEIEQRRSANRAKGLIVVAMIVFLALLVGAWFFAFTTRNAAESDLKAAKAETEQKQSDLAQYDYIPEVSARLDSARFARAWAGATDINWATQLQAFLSTAGAQVRLTNLVVSQATPFAPLSEAGGPFTRPDLGVVSFTGEATSPLSVADLQDAIDALPGFQDTIVTDVQLNNNVDTDTVYWVYTATTRVSANALSGRLTTEQEIVPIEDEDAAATEGEG